MNESKKKIVYITSSAVALLILIVCLVFVFKKYSSKAGGEIILEFIDLDNKVLETKNIEFKSGETLYEVCQKEYDNIKLDGDVLNEIGPLKYEKTDTYLIYIALYVDDEYSAYYFNQIPFSDGTKITFKLDKYSYA